MIIGHPGHRSVLLALAGGDNVHAPDAPGRPALVASQMDGSAQISAGMVTPRPVTMSGGAPAAWTMLERAGSVLVWSETGGGPDLYFDPMCD